MSNKPLDRLRHHVSGAIARGEAQAIAEAPTHAAMEARLANFGRLVLRILQDDTQWSSDTLQAIADRAHARGLTTCDDPFKAAPGILESPAPKRRDYGAPIRVWLAPGRLFVALPPRSERAASQWRQDDGLWQGLEVNPFRARHVAYAPGPHLGQRVAWHQLPDWLKRELRASFLADYCPKADT